MTRALHVLVVAMNYAPEPTGSAPYTAGLAEGLVRRGHRVTVWTAQPHYPNWRIYPGFGRQTRRQVLAGVDVQRLACYIPRRPRAVGRLLYELSLGLSVASRRTPRDLDAVVLACPALFTSALALLPLRLRRIPTMAWVQDLYGRGLGETALGGPRAARLVSGVESLVLRSVDRVVAIHPRMQGVIVDDLGVPRDRTRLVRNWTQPPLPPSRSRDEIRRTLGWALDRFVILHAGNMGHKQGLEVAVEAARLASARGLPWDFVLLGDGNQRTYLEGRGRGVPNLRFIDPLPSQGFHDALCAADLLLLTDKPGVGSMSVPSKLTSYFGAGRPVLASTDEHGNAATELLAARAGRLARPGDAEDLLKQAGWFHDNPLEGRKMGRSGRLYCTQNLSVENSIDGLEEILLDRAEAARMGQRKTKRKRRT